MRKRVGFVIVILIIVMVAYGAATLSPKASEIAADTPAPIPTSVPTSMPTSTPLATSTPSAAATNAPVPVPGALPAFPGAEGFGAETVGGRGGTVIEVTNLNDSGPGSLRACIEASGPRICVFRVGGMITVESDMDITNPFITIAGQTAPGDGITLRASGNDVGSPIRVRTQEVIIRYLRSRPGTTGLNNRALTIGNQHNPPFNVIVDHSSFSWSGDELIIAWYNTQKITLQWNYFTESLPSSDGTVGLKGPNLGSAEGGYYSFHHNLVAHHLQRLPSISTGAGPVDVVNNVMYNAGSTGTRAHNMAQINFVGNYIKAGPNTTLETWVRDAGVIGFYVSDNVLEGKGILQRLLPDSSRIVSQPFVAPAITTTSATVAYEQVLEMAGATQGLTCDGSWFFRRDAVDRRVADSVRQGTRGHSLPVSETAHQLGYINSPADVGGWPNLASGTACPDGDHDGMPDEWERARGFDPAVDDSALFMPDGYTRLEHYLNAMD
ncbi:MAG: pectate lyase [Caldilineaceae bacterium]|nr:pectate lyase [Caldilineaceae bacterium]